MFWGVRLTQVPHPTAMHFVDLRTFLSPGSAAPHRIDQLQPVAVGSRRNIWYCPSNVSEARLEVDLVFSQSPWEKQAILSRNDYAQVVKCSCTSSARYYWHFTDTTSLVFDGWYCELASVGNNPTKTPALGKTKPRLWYAWSYQYHVYI